MSKRLFPKLVMATLASCLVAPSFADEDAILARTDMPNSIIPQAEVRLVRQGEETIVQSAILPHFPHKVLKKIVKSEHDNWPGNRDAQEYITVLTEAFLVYEKEHDLKTTALVIDFVTAPGTARIDFLFPGAVRNETGIVLQPSSVWRSLALSEHYIRKNQEYILTDAFGKDAQPLIQILGNTTDAEDGK